ncbi:MAG: RnfABCDGE type electron transport complex subunit D [Oscillospiraceae bacterium]|nr:RnfABCDGE type electron transport complex subunit D [Oscillospiraceae bacterium]
MDKEKIENIEYALEVRGKSTDGETTALSVAVSALAPSAEPATEPPPDKAPKFKSNRSRIYFEQLLCLLLIGGVGYWNAGGRVIAMAVFSLLGAVIMDMVGCALTKKVYNPRDLSTLTAGLCVALLMPAGIDYRLVFFGSVLTIAIKHVFGGKNNYIFNPTAVAFVFLILCYPGQMLLFSRPLEHLPLWGEIDPTVLMRAAPLENARSFDILMGNITGSIGTVHILVITVSGLCLLFRRSVSATVTVTALLTNLLFAGVIGGSVAQTFHASLVVMATSSFLFVLLFLANDPQTLPETLLGKIYYGIMFGGGTVLFKTFGKVDGTPVFALLLVNTMNERADILAQQTITYVKRAYVSAKNRLNSYERIQEKVAGAVDTPLLANHDSETPAALEMFIARHIPGKSGDSPAALTYNMPPIDNKIIKINRKKPNLIARFKEKLGSLAENEDYLPESSSETSRADFFENLRASVKDLGAMFRKSATLPPEVSADEELEAPELTPLDLLLRVDENDVVEVEVSGAEKEKEKVDKRKKKRAKSK